MVEMQYRGDVFRQRRQARDWTVATFLRDPDQGPGLEVATDSRTDDAARRALAGLLDLPLDGWRKRHLGVDDFDGLLVDDKERDLLRWIADTDAALREPERRPRPGARSATRSSATMESMSNRRAHSRLQLIAPSAPLRRVGARSGTGLADAPQQFRSCAANAFEKATQQKQGDLLRGLKEGDLITNPHDNAIAEKAAGTRTSAKAFCSSREAAEKTIALEERHRARRGTLWARLGEAPLAAALEHLARLAAATERTLPGDDLAALASAYVQDGWQVDAAL